MSELTDTLAESLPDLLDTMGDSVSYTHYVSGVTDSIQAIWNTSGEYLLPAAKLAGVLTVSESDLSSAPEKGDTVTIASKIYKVVDMNNLDLGMRDLGLRFVQDVIS